MSYEPYCAWCNLTGHEATAGCRDRWQLENAGYSMREIVARIIDPHSFLPVHEPDDPGGWPISYMVNQSKADAFRKADRIIAALSLSPASGEKDERIAELETALRVARENVVEWAGYASDYFREKHDLAGDLQAIDAALTSSKEG
jgi:hypothetical protein